MIAPTLLLPIPLSSPHAAPQHEVSVTLKLVQVHVEDEAGNPVKDLKREDFILYDNRELKIITDFERHFLDAEPNQIDPKGDIASAFRMNRKFLFLIDLVGNDSIGLLEAKTAAMHFIETQLQPGDEVGILSYTPMTGLILHTYFTTDMEAIKRAIADAKEVPLGKSPAGLSLATEVARAEAGAGRLGPESSATQMLSRGFREPPLATAPRTKVNLPLSLVELSQALRYIPGIKNVVLFSGGGGVRLQGLYEYMARELAAANCQVYTVNTYGQRAHFRGYMQIGEDNLKAVADFSGGKYYETTEGYDMIARDIQSLTGNYYVLGYYIDSKWDGKYHEIKVEVKRPGCRVRAQAGYFNPRPFSSLSDLEKQLHLIDVAMSRNPYFEAPDRFPLLGIGHIRQGNGTLLLLSEIRSEAIRQALGTEIEIFTLIFDRENTVVESNRGEINFRTIPEDDVCQYSILSLEQGRYECRVVLRNSETGRSAVGTTSVEVDEAEGRGVSLYPPFLLAPRKPCFFLFSHREGETDSMKNRSLQDFCPLLVKGSSPVIGAIPSETEKILAVLRFSVGEETDLELDLTVTLRDGILEKDSPVMFIVLDSKKLGSEDALLIEIDLPELSPGGYALDFALSSARPGIGARVSRELVVR
jgi:VWFA-related protein